jgi:lysozyme family protein
VTVVVLVNATNRVTDKLSSLPVPRLFTAAAAAAASGMAHMAASSGPASTLLT